MQASHLDDYQLTEALQDITPTNIITPNGDGLDDVLRFTVEEIVKIQNSGYTIGG
ncbi:MAG: hypothetical protein R2766_10110 [Saprospiraceae bacterium]